MNIEEIEKAVEYTKQEPDIFRIPELIKRVMTRGEEKVYILLRDNAEELIRLAKIGERMQWQPIETAPKDGKRVLVFVPPYGPFTAHNTFWLFDQVRDEWHIPGLLNKEAQPTHWMPLPEPPK